MNLLTIWEEFINLLSAEVFVKKAFYNKIAGIPFLYIEVDNLIDIREIEYTIRKSAAIAMKGKQLRSETIYVRSDHPTYVYRHRFYVPQEKMFCCGNLCVDCIRLRKS